MKKIKIIAIVATIVFVAVFSAQAQAPYKHSIGVTAGTLEAVSYKSFITNHFAFQADLGYQYIVTDVQYWGKSFELQALNLNPNFMYEGTLTKGLYGFVGGGVSIGYLWINPRLISGAHPIHASLGKFGTNAIVGLEYKFNIPLTLQFDFRPGYGLIFDEYKTLNFFDWNLCAGVRYTF